MKENLDKWEILAIRTCKKNLQVEKNTNCWLEFLKKEIDIKII